jgi:hypothetical protein
MPKNPQNPPLKPGDKAPHSGLYEQVGPRGGQTNKQITSVKGETLPPTNKKGSTYVLVVPAKNGAGEG